MIGVNSSGPLSMGGLQLQKTRYLHSLTTANTMTTYRVGGGDGDGDGGGGRTGPVCSGSLSAHTGSNASNYLQKWKTEFVCIYVCKIILSCWQNRINANKPKKHVDIEFNITVI